MDPGAEDIDGTGDLIQGALELAIAQARRDAGTPGAPPPPAALRPVLRFTRMPARALQVVRTVLDEDDAFRTRVAESVDETDLDRASWLFLTRPDGWREEFELLLAAASEQVADRRTSREEQRAGRRVAQLEENLERLRDDLAALRATLAEAERSAAADRAAKTELARERDALGERVASLEQERARAVRSLKNTEATAVTRLEELRAVRGQLADALEREQRERAAPSPAPVAPVEPVQAEPPRIAPAPSRPSPWDDRDPTVVAAAVLRAGGAAAELAAALQDAARALQVPTGPSAAVDAAVEDVAVPRPPRPPRRTPVRLRQGLHSESIEGLEQLLATPGIVVIVDGYNVSQEGWPNLGAAAQRESLVAALGVVTARTGSTVHVVFDGDAEGGRPSVSAPLPVRVHFSPAEVEADDVILGMVSDLPTDVPVLVISTDRRVSDGARRLGANAVRSRWLLELIRR